MQALADTLTYLRSIDSTNNYAIAQLSAGLAKHGDAYLAHEQYAGKGQRGKQWVANPGENLIFSVIVEPKLLITQQFLLSMAVALACRDLVITVAPDDIFIKWPNDIYWNDRKAGGILIENIIKNGEWSFAVIGIGLNINQGHFKVEGTQPVSLMQLTGKKFNIKEMARKLSILIDRRTLEANSNPCEIIRQYNEVLFKKRQAVLLKKGAVTFQATIEGVNQWGELMTFSGVQQVFKVGEVEFVR